LDSPPAQKFTLTGNNTQRIIEVLSTPVINQKYDSVADDIAEIVDKHISYVNEDANYPIISYFKVSSSAK